MYAEGITRGAPDATQVTDRFHLLMNLREALEGVVVRHYAQVDRPPPPSTMFQRLMSWMGRSTTPPPLQQQQLHRPWSSGGRAPNNHVLRTEHAVWHAMKPF